MTNAYVGKSMYKSGKNRVTNALESETFRKIKDGILDNTEEGLIKGYNLGQKVKERIFGIGKKEDGNTS